LAVSQARETALLACTHRARRALLADELSRGEIAADVETCIAERGADYDTLEAFVDLAYHEGLEDVLCPFYEARVEGDNGHARGVETCKLMGNSEACMGYPSFCNLLESHEEGPQRGQQAESVARVS
jgi:hypothetical protein